MKVTIQDSRTSVTVEPRDFRVTVSGARGPAGPAGANEWGEITGDIIDQTDLYNALEGKVPYTGATGDVNLGEHKLLFANASELREGTYDFGGQGGISQICSVGFENNWQSGFNHIFDNNGLIRESLHCFDIVPDSSFDSSLRFKIGSLWKLDDGTIYECVDATIGAAVWQLYNPYETDISGLVPYTGATADVNLGEYGAQLGNLEFDNTPTNVPTTAGSVYWSDTDGTLNMVLKGGQTISRIGETQHIRALNNTGSQIARGKIVYVVGAQGQRLTIALADADTEILSKDTIGFTSEAIADGAEGFVIVQGVVNNISTTGMTDGATVYLSQTAGGYTTTPPPDPAHLVILGFIVNGGSGGAGSIYVKVDNGYELEELHNVSNSAKTTPVGDDALFLRDSADNNLWKRLTWTNALAGVKTHMDTFKSVAGGYASLDGSGKVPSSELPSYVDDVVEVANYAALPVTGETGKIYVTLDTNKCYRWSGTVYVQVAQGVDTLTTTGTSGAATLVGSTLNIPQYQSVLTNPVTGTGTAGQVSYWSGTGTQTGSSAFTWDGTLLSLTSTSQASTRETLMQFKLSDSSNDSFFIANGSSFNNVFWPSFTGYGNSNQRAGLQFLGLVTNTSDVVDTATSILHFECANIGTDTTTPLSATRVAVNNKSLFGFFNSSTNLMAIFPNGNINIGVPLSTSPSARLHVRGSGTTSSTTALLVQNSTPSALLTVADDGATLSQATFAPTSGTAIFTNYRINPTINQTGGANGITRGLYVNPTLTAAADWRSIETSNNTGWGLYGAGTANNYLGGSLGIGTTTLSNSSLVAQKLMTGSASINNVLSSSPIASDVTTEAAYYSTNSGTQAASFTLTFLEHYAARQGTFGLGSTVTNQYGFFVSSGLTGATNNYGFYSNIASGTGRWNLYMNGTAANYLAGNTSIGTTTSSGRLTVQGSGTTSSTKALVVNNSTPTAIFEILDNGRINQTIPGASTNTLFGTDAGANSSLSNNNHTAFGRQALFSTTTSANCTAIGREAAYNGDIGDTTAVGYRALYANISGFGNTAIGTAALAAVTSGNNVGVGRNAGSSLTASTNNLILGYNAGRFIIDGVTALTVANNSVFLGFDTRAAADSQSNQIVIGYQAIGNGSNTATLGNTSITNTYLRGNINYTEGGNFVIGTTTGTKIGTATSQKIGLWNATPIVQPTTAVAAATRVGGGGTTVTDSDTFDGYTIAQLVKALRNMGALA